MKTVGYRVDAIFTQSGLQNWCWIYLFALQKLPKETDWCVPLSTVAIFAVSTVISIAHVQFAPQFNYLVLRS